MPDVRMPNGTVIRNVPAGTTKAQLLEKLQRNGYNTAELLVAPQEENALEKVPVIGDALAAVADLPLNAVSGLAGVGKSFTDVFGAGNAASNFLNNVSQGAQDWQSSEARRDALISAADMAQAEGKGTWEEIKAAGRSFLRSPLDTTAQVAGSALPFVAAAVTGGGIPAAIGLGAASGAGTIKGTIYDATLKAAKNTGLSDEQAQAVAERAQEYDGKNLDQIALGTAIGAAASATGLPRQLSAAIAKRGATEVIEQLTAKSVAAGTVKGALEEAIPEAIQGGQERLAGNIAQDREGYGNGNVWTGVAGQAALEGISSLLMGAYGGRKETIAENSHAIQKAVVEEAANLPPEPTDEQFNDFYTRLTEVRGFPEQVAQRVVERMAAEREAIAEQERMRTARKEEAVAARTADIAPEDVFVEPDINAPMPPEGAAAAAPVAEPEQGPPPIDPEEEAARYAAYAPPNPIPSAETITPQAQFANQMGVSPMEQRNAEMDAANKRAREQMNAALAARGLPSVEEQMGSRVSAPEVAPTEPVAPPKFQPSVVDEGRARNILDDPALLKQWQAQGYTEQDLVDITKGEGPTILFSRRGRPPKDTETGSLFGDMATQAAPSQELKRDEFNQFRFAPEEQKAQMREAVNESVADAQSRAEQRNKEFEAVREETLGDIEYALRAQAPENAPYKVVYNPENEKAPYQLVAERTLGDPQPVPILSAKTLPEFSDQVYGRMMELTPFNPSAVGADEVTEAEAPLSGEDVQVNEGPERTPYNRMVQDFTAEVDAAREAGEIDNLQRSELLRRFERPNAYRTTPDGRSVPNDAIAKLEADFVDARSALTNADVESRPEAQKNFITAEQRLRAAVQNSLLNPARAALKSMVETRKDERLGAKVRVENADLQRRLGEAGGENTAPEQAEVRDARIDLKETKVPRASEGVIEPSEEELATVEAAMAGKNATELLEWMTETGPDKLYRAVASRVLALAKHMEDVGLGFEVNLVQPGDTAPDALEGAEAIYIPANYPTEAGKPDTPRPRRPVRSGKSAIWVRGAAFGNMSGASYNTLLHEFIHAVTDAMLYAPEAFPTHVRIGVRNLEKAFDKLNQHIEQRKQEIRAGGDYVSEFERRMLNGFNNVADNMHELLAWALSDIDAQNYLATIPSGMGKKSVWDRLVDIMSSMFRIKGAEQSLFADILRASDRIMDISPGEMSEAFLGRAQAPRQGILLSRRGSEQAKATEEIADNQAAASVGLRRAQRSIDVNGIASGTSEAIKTRKFSAYRDGLNDNIDGMKPMLRRAWLKSIPTSGILGMLNGEIQSLNDVDKLIHQMSNMKANIAKAADPIAKRLSKFLVNDTEFDLAKMQSMARINEVSPDEFKDMQDALTNNKVIQEIERRIRKNANTKAVADQLIADIKALAMSDRAFETKQGDLEQKSNALRALIFKMERDAKDGLESGRHAEQLAEMTRRVRDTYLQWDKLGKMKGGQQLYKEMRQFYKDMFEAELALLDARIDTLAGDDKEQAKRLKDLRADMMREAMSPEEARKKGDIFAGIDPTLFSRDYFPFMREGKYWLRVMGDKHGVREKEFYQFHTAKERNRAVRAVAERLGVDPENSEVIDYGNDVSTLQEDLKDGDLIMQRVFELVAKTKENVADRGMATTKDVAELADAIYQTWLLSTPERSVRRRFMHSENITGFQQDLLQQFSSQVTAYSNQLSKMAYAGDVRLALQAAEQSLTGRPTSERAKLRDFIQEMSDRAESEINPEPQNAVVNALNRMSYFYYLTSAASALVNLTSIPIRVLPRMWRDYGFTKGSAMYVKYMKLWKTLGNTRVEKEKLGVGDKLHAIIPDLNGSSYINQKGERGDLLRRAMKIGMQHNMLETVSDTLIQNERETTKRQRTGAARVAAETYAGVSETMSVLFSSMENISRQAAYYMTFELAYDDYLAKNPGKKDDAFEHAVEKALGTTRDTLGDYSNFERPSIAKGNLTRALFLFKMYPIVQTKFMVGAMRDIVKNRNPGDRAGALKELMGVTMMAGMFGGLTGMPLYSLMALIFADSFDDEDDEDVRKLMGLDPRVAYDSDIMFRSWLMEKFGTPQGSDIDVADIFIHGPVGALTNTDVASRTSLDLKNMWFREAVAGDSTADTVIKTLLANVAPGQMAISLFDAKDKFAEGDIYGGLKKALPAFFRGPVGAIQQAEEGIKDSKGNTVISKDEINEYNLIQSALGFRPMKLSRWQDYYITRAKNETDINGERNAIFNKFDRMRRDGEMNNVADLNKFIQEEVVPFNRTYPSEKFVIEIPDLIKSAKGRDKMRGMTVSGMRVDAKTGARDLEQANRFRPN